jgi:lysozyme
MFNQYCLGVDVSHWQAQVEWPQLYAAGVRFAIVKASQGNYRRDPLLHTHVRGAAAAGMLCGVYHWFDPSNSPASQITNLQVHLKGVDFDFCALDVEQYWQDWEEWKRQAVTRRFSGEVISQGSLEMAHKLRAWSAKPVLIYTRASFVTEYAPQMAAWLPDWPLWLAHYPYPGGRESLGWQVLKQNWAPAIPAPLLPARCTDWDFWQFSGDKFVLPGCQSPLDLNFFHGDLPALQGWLGRVPLPELTLEEKIQRLWQAHPDLWKQQEVPLAST